MAFCCLLWAGLREEAWANHFLSSFCVIHSRFCSINTFCDFFIRFMINLGFILTILKFALFVFPLNHFVVFKSEREHVSLKWRFKPLEWLECLLICVFKETLLCLGNGKWTCQDVMAHPSRVKLTLWSIKISNGPGQSLFSSKSSRDDC